MNKNIINAAKIGDKNRGLTYTGVNVKHGTKTRGIFVCDCGNSVELPIDRVYRGEFRGCRQCNDAKYGPQQEMKEKLGVDYGFYIILQQIKKGAECRNLDNQISLEQLKLIWDRQNGECFYTGIKLYFPIKRDDLKLENGVSVDRIDSNKGYTCDNVVFVHKDINTMKQFYSHDRFVKLCRLISANMNHELSSELMDYQFSSRSPENIKHG